MRRFSSLVPVLFAAAGYVAHAQAPAPIRASAAGLVSIGRVDSIWSAAIKEHRRFQVYLPPGYTQTTYEPRAYPVLYLLDGDTHFHSLTGALQFLSTGGNGTNVVPEMIVVSIPNTNRTRDLTPTHGTTTPDGTPTTAFAASGGGPAFLQFVRNELIPHIDSTYRVSLYRVFVGHSLGGITVLDALYTMPDVFNAYVAIDPSLWWDNKVLLNKAGAYFAKRAPPNRVLFIGQANTLEPRATPKDTNEHFRSIRKFDALLASANTSGIRYSYKYYPDDDHGSVPLIAEYDALRFIFAEYKLNDAKAQERPETIAEHFASVSKTLGYQVLPPERQLDRLAATAMDSLKRVTIAKLAADFYPLSSHAQLILGNAYLSALDTASARTALTRALALDPSNAAAKSQLDKLGAAR